MKKNVCDLDFCENLFVGKSGLKLQSGKYLAPFEIAYNTYGRLNSGKSNAILVCHALTSDQHIANRHPVTGKSGWWSLVVGPGKAIDTDKYFVICANTLGGCMGSTGPSSTRVTDGKVYGLSFPMVTIGDMVSAQVSLIDHLGIDRLLCVIGGSMGGMQSLQWCAANPSRLKSALIIASACRHSPQNIALHEVGRQAIMADSNWFNGRYFEHSLTPRKGLAVARMAAHVTYLSERALQNKFGRNLQSGNNLSYGFDVDFQIESYLRHQGKSFVDRFDANTYLYLTRAMDYFDLCNDFNCSLQDILGNCGIHFCLLSFSSDWLFPTKMSREISDALAFNGSKVSFVEIESDSGHDSFLLDMPEMFSIVKGFLANLS